MKICVVDATLDHVRQQLKQDTSVSPSLRSTIMLPMLQIPILVSHFSTNSRNRTKPPSQDTNLVMKEV